MTARALWDVLADERDKHPRVPGDVPSALLVHAVVHWLDSLADDPNYRGAVADEIAPFVLAEREYAYAYDDETMRDVLRAAVDVLAGTEGVALDDA